jgi:glyoxylase-like metal-dependent hydrolase (beta-lactamase superfamily II)
MFGQVPKPLWGRFAKADAQNRIPLVVRALLVRTGDETVLVETGLGEIHKPAEARRLQIEAVAGSLPTALAAEGVALDQIGHLILTHLHFDHVAGIAARTPGGIRPLLPRAKVYLQRSHWTKARAPGPKEQDSFRPTDLDLLEQMDLHLLDGDRELLPGLRVRVSDGHTRGMQMVIVQGKEDQLYFPSDLIPLLAHVRSAFTAGYDTWPERLVEEKLALLQEVAERNSLLVFVHDPLTAAGRLQQGPRGFRIGSREKV